MLKYFNIDKNKFANELLINNIDITKSGKIYLNDLYYSDIRINFSDILKYIKNHKNLYLSHTIIINKQKFVIKFFAEKFQIFRNNGNDNNYICTRTWFYEPFDEKFNIRNAREYIQCNLLH